MGWVKVMLTVKFIALKASITTTTKDLKPVMKAFTLETEWKKGTTEKEVERST